METLNCTHPLASSAGNVSKSELMSLLRKEELQEFILKIPTLIMMILYVLLGIPGNIIVLIIYKLNFRSSTTKIFILSLSSFDLINCVIGIPFEMVDLRFDIELDMPIPCKVLRFAVTFCACGSTLILLSVAVDRFRRICQPFRRQLSTKQSLVVVGMMAFLSLVISLPALVFYGRRSEVYRDVVLVDCTIDDAWDGSGISKGYQFILGMLWVFSILALCIMYGVIIIKIREQEIRRLNITSTSVASFSVSKFNSTGGFGRKMSASSSDGDFKSVNESKSKPKRKVSKVNINGKGEFSNDAADPPFPKRGNFLSRLFSRDVNPIAEENDETDVVTTPRLCGIEEHHLEEGLAHNETAGNSYSQDMNTDDDNRNKINTVNGSSTSEPSSKSFENTSRFTTFTSSARNNYIPRHRRNNNDNDSNDNKAPDSTENPSANRSFQRSTSMPVTSSELQITENITLSRTESEIDNSNSRTHLNESCHFQNNQSSQNVRIEFDEPSDETSSKGPDITSPQTGSSIGHKYKSTEISLDGITSTSDQTNGSILTLHNSKVTTNRTRKLSTRSEVARQVSMNSQEGNSERKRQHKTSVSSLSSVGRTHKSSICQGRQPSIASTRELRTSKIAIMMCHVTMAHVLSYLPHLAIQFHRALGPNSLARLLCNSVYFAFYHLLLRSIFLNSAINPVIYSYNNGQFRNHCKQLMMRPVAFFRRRIRSSTLDSGHSISMD